MSFMHDWRRCLLDAEPVQQITSAPRRIAQTLHTDPEADELVQQPASAAASLMKLNPAAESAQNFQRQQVSSNKSV